jgi:hypothetical protein
MHVSFRRDKSAARVTNCVTIAAVRIMSCLKAGNRSGIQRLASSLNFLPSRLSIALNFYLARARDLPATSIFRRFRVWFSSLGGLAQDLITRISPRARGEGRGGRQCNGGV